MAFRGTFQGSQNKASPDLGRLKVASGDMKMTISEKNSILM